MSFRDTNPELVISRIQADAARLVDWASKHGSVSQQRIAANLRDAVNHVAPQFYNLNAHGKRELTPRE